MVLEDLARIRSVGVGSASAVQVQEIGRELHRLAESQGWLREVGFRAVSADYSEGVVLEPVIRFREIPAEAEVAFEVQLFDANDNKDRDQEILLTKELDRHASESGFYLAGQLALPFPCRVCVTVTYEDGFSHRFEVAEVMADGQVQEVAH